MNLLKHIFPIVAVLNCIVLAMASAQFVQQGSKLVGSGVNQGRSVSISSDGNTAIVGNIGAALVFIRTGGVWTQQGDELVGTGSVGFAYQGWSVSLSSDGNTAIVGGYNDSGAVGAAWVFTRTGGVWSQQGDKLVGTGAVGAAGQGSSVSLSSDGNSAIVGGSSDNGGVGAAWVFTRTGGAWSQQGNKLVGDGAAGPVYQGCSVSISSDGNTTIVGGYVDSSSVGAAWIFTRAGGVWSQQGNKLVGDGAAGQAFQGYSVSISSDGNTAILGGYVDSSSVGAAWIFTRAGGVWSQQGDKLVGTGAVGAAGQGWSVSLSSDGNTAIVGGYTDDSNVGAAWVFARSGGVWSQQGNKLVGTPAAAAYQGYSVSISSDGNTAIVGGVADNGGVGAAWVFTATAFVFSVGQSWNLVSVPVTTSDYRRTQLFPSSTSSAYAFDQATGYVQKDTLKNGLGYWLKFGSSQVVGITGLLRNVDTVDVKNGWNIIGSISHPAITNLIIQIPTGIVISNYYGYGGSYTAADTLKSGAGYWVKVNQNGKLVLH